MNAFTPTHGENIVLALRSLYGRYGYTRYKMNKFEEYDLYARNKDFLVSESIITFTDTNGKLMALKPDVTLSIVKNTKDEKFVQKMYYTENVYRVSKGTHSYKEIMQVGLEALGDIDDYTIFEVLKLALGSLRATARRCVLQISHLGILSEVIEKIGIPAGAQAEVLHYIAEKNRHELKKVCVSYGIDEMQSKLLTDLISLSGTPETVIPALNDMLSGVIDEATLTEFTTVVNLLRSEDTDGFLQIDFSVINNQHYYNGFVFAGFAEGVPSSILSGGQYDTLMKKMKHSAGAIGFAVYLDLLEQYDNSRQKFDVDNILIYDENTLPDQIRQVADALMCNGESVLVQQNKPEQLKYKKLIKIEKGEVKTVENNA